MPTKFFASDLHLDHHWAATELRGHDTIEEHNETLVELWNLIVGKRDTVYVLGDISFTSAALTKHFARMRGNKVVVLGNHDKSANTYQPLCNSAHGVRTLSSKHFPTGFLPTGHRAWLTHIPIHPQELRDGINIHGHIHHPADNLGAGYLNVNYDVLPVSCQPIPFDDLPSLYTTQCRQATGRWLRMN